MRSLIENFGTLMDRFTELAFKYCQCCGTLKTLMILKEHDDLKYLT